MSAPPAAPARARAAAAKAAPAPPLRLEDLACAGAALRGQPPERAIAALHQAAVDAGRDMYVDPQSGYNVFTSAALARRPCCGNRCRHCPYEHANVAENKAARQRNRQQQRQEQQQQQREQQQREQQEQEKPGGWQDGTLSW
ncbi:hypothetical protein Rsub_01268 [Raphidocelis subcapitata]|uniref:Uncharacterized protein n=1 Tax=Raphidocelis subcapitata TaxID=307507 RepID=A0A2V0NSP1_9CHLO|nr:hypothetical protein Rsub_01268 [Raphidocelis subcapitata]|eukprot:GBF88553.1 hypothetical protein Rsub_01268 [Raphidocelis subcapitata]